MLSRIRKQINPATGIALVALVFALTGGAFAASSHGGPGAEATGGRGSIAATTAKKKAAPKGKAGPRGPAGPAGKTGAAGPTGAPGPAGAAGPAGPQGAAGTNGTDGNNGTNGENVTVAKASGTECKEGGSKFTVSAKSEDVCNGSPWTAGGTLPKGASEQGIWTADSYVKEEFLLASAGVSFNIALSTAPTAHYINSNGEELTATGAQPSTVCKGTAANPTAPEGVLCVYTGLEIGGAPFGYPAANGLFGNVGWMWSTAVTTEIDGNFIPNTAMPFGFTVVVMAGAPEEIDHAGSWAVTG